ncbi:hypothetical protein N9222_01090 [Pseudomonadales bacterium]|nr:hypothetical protein [Pseudomonadales bacterium]
MRRLPEEPSPTLQDWLDEFDLWVTPELETIQDTEDFKVEIEALQKILDRLSELTNRFESEELLSSSNFVDAVFDYAPAAAQGSFDQIWAAFREPISLLYLVTGKSDNNLKCQYPLYLQNEKGVEKIPAVKTTRGVSTITQMKLPRTLKADDLCKRITELYIHESLHGDPDVSKTLLGTFVEFVLKSHEATLQLWVLGKSYVALKAISHEAAVALLTPIVIFKIRGSVAAKGGHKPEALVRDYLADWGLEADVDFNIYDVDPIAMIEGSDQEGNKTRAYDLLLPYKTEGWEPKLFVQAQFYAGDSGSVSHKNVDQALTSRRAVSEHYDNPLFLEYVDGAGYFSSLNGDLKKLLSMPSTYNFFQIRSIPVRLRRAIQEVGFLLPVDLAVHALHSSGDRYETIASLKADGYSYEEIKRCITSSIRLELVACTDTRIEIIDPFLEIAKDYALLDCVVHAAMKIGDTKGAAFIPGYGEHFGCRLDKLAEEFGKTALVNTINSADILQNLYRLSSRGQLILS